MNNERYKVVYAHRSGGFLLYTYATTKKEALSKMRECKKQIGGWVKCHE